MKKATALLVAGLTLAGAFNGEAKTNTATHYSPELRNTLTIKSKAVNQNNFGNQEVKNQEGLEGFGGDEICSEAGKHLKEVALNMIVQSNGDFHSNDLKDKLIEASIGSANEMIKGDLNTDQAAYDAMHQKEFNRMKRKNKIGFTEIKVIFENDSFFAKLFGDGPLKFDEDDSKAKPVKTARMAVNKAYTDGFRELIKKTLTYRATMGMEDAQVKATDEVASKVMTAYKKFLEALWEYNKNTYAGKGK